MAEFAGITPPVINPLSKLGAEAVLIQHFGSGKAEVAAAVALAPEKEVLASAMEHATSGKEAFKFIERGKKPEDRHQEIENVTSQMGVKPNEKGKDTEPAPGSPEAKRRDQTAERENLINEWQMKGYDGMGDGKNPDDPTSSMDKAHRQAYLIVKMRREMLDDPNHAETFSKLQADAQDKFIIDELKTDHTIMAGKTDTYSVERRAHPDFASVNTTEASLEIRSAKRAIAEAQEPIKLLDGRIAESKEAMIKLYNQDKAEVEEARTHKEDKKTIRNMKPRLDQVKSDYFKALADAQNDPNKLNESIKLANERLAIENDPVYKQAVDRTDIVRNYDETMAQYKTEIRELESQKRLAALKIDDLRDNLTRAQKSLDRMQNERDYREQQYADGVFHDTLGRAFMDRQYEKNEALIARVSARIPDEEQELTAQRTEAERAAVAVVNTHMDERWKKERRIPGITQLKEWKTKTTKEFAKWWDSLTDPERERYENGTEKVTRLAFVDDDYQRIINQDNGVDQAMRECVTPVPGGRAGNKTFAELDEMLPDEKKLKDMLRNAALRHTLDVRYELSAELGRKSGEPPRQVTDADRNKIMSRSWIDKGVLDGIETEQGARALSEVDPTVPGDTPVSQETIDKAKAGDKPALETIKSKMKTSKKAFLWILGLSAVAMVGGGSFLKESEGAQPSP